MAGAFRQTGERCAYLFRGVAAGHYAAPLPLTSPSKRSKNFK